jgi:uncharacterized protein YjbI with pentapeptide repeats
MDSESPKIQTLALPVPQRRYAPLVERKETLRRHCEWLESNGEIGERADFSGAHLEGADLTDANLKDAWLNKAILKDADLLLANLERASLLQANLQGANLLGTRLREADLQGALLENTVGLQSEQLAGANLLGATLPADVSVFEALKDVADTARTAGWLVLSMLLLNVAAGFRILTTTDAQILGNAPILPFRIFRVFPFDAVYLLAPALILGLYVWLHLYLQRVWESVSTLPAIFPDGRSLDRLLPWFTGQVARAHLKWQGSKNSPLVALEAVISQIVLYWIVPATTILFWGRYLTFEDLRGTTLHVLLVVAACTAAIFFSRAMRRTLGARSEAGAAPQESLAKRKTLLRADFAGTCTLALGAAMLLLSVGVVSGSPRDDGSKAAGRNYRIQTWAADALWLIGYRPVAQVGGADISEKPSNWTGRDEDLAQVRGARLDNVRLRYIQAYGAFFAKADLRHADFENAELSEADLREVKARQANLRYAVMDRAKLDRAILQVANLEQSNLTRASLEKADLSYASLNAAILIDSNLDGASLYGSDLRGASLQRASLQQADLREANLAGADLTAANLGNAYLSSAKMAGAKLENAELDAAFLTQADLRGADLRNAKLAGAALNGANLQGADLRGALGLGATQICTAAEIGQVQLDEGLRQQVETECGGNASH